LEVFRILRDWFKSINTDFAKLVAFEIDIIIHSVMIVKVDLGYMMASLPSGIGVTQFIGTVIHALIDKFVELPMKWVVYQSDDTAGVTDGTESEIQSCYDEIYKILEWKFHLWVKNLIMGRIQ